MSIRWIRPSLSVAWFMHRVIRSSCAAGPLGAAISVAVALALVAVPAHAQPLDVLGILEDIEPSQDDAQAGTAPLVTRLRASFAKTGAGWRPVCQLGGLENDRLDCLKDVDARTTWTVSHRTKRLGEVVTAGWYDASRYRTIGVLGLETRDPPRLAESGRPVAGGGTAVVHRPLVAATRPRLRPPTGWRETAVSREDLVAAVAFFTPYMARLPGCSPDQPVADAPALAPEHFAGIVALVSRSGERAFGVRLREALRKGCDALPGVEWSDFWLHVKGRAAPQLIALSPMKETVMRFTLVDWGDFDGDGRIDVIFRQATAEEDGYVLVHGGFENLVRATWPNH